MQMDVAKQNNAFSRGQSRVTLENVFDRNVALYRALIPREYGLEMKIIVGDFESHKIGGEWHSLNRSLIITDFDLKLPHKIGLKAMLRNELYTSTISSISDLKVGRKPSGMVWLPGVLPMILTRDL